MDMSGYKTELRVKGRIEKIQGKTITFIFINTESIATMNRYFAPMRSNGYRLPFSPNKFTVQIPFVSSEIREGCDYDITLHTKFYSFPVRDQSTGGQTSKKISGYKLVVENISHCIDIARN